MNSTLANAARSRIMDDMVHLQPDAWKVLVVDAVGLKLVNSLCKLDDIHDRQFAAVEFLENRKRKQFPDYEGYYFMEPSAHNIQLIIDEWSGRPPYATAHLFCTTALPDSLFDRMKRSPLSSRIRSLKELNIDFIVQESLVFSLDRRESAYPIFNPQSTTSFEKEISQIAKQLSFVLGTIGEYPHIRYYNPAEKSFAYNYYSSSAPSLCETLAKSLDRHLKNMKKQSPDAFSKAPTDSEKSTILLIDRTVDVMAPLMHEFTYQALLADVVRFDKDGMIKWDGEGSVKGRVVIDEQNDAWLDIRHKHIADSMDFVAEGVREFASQNVAAQYAKDGKSGNSIEQITKMQQTLAALPEFQKKKAIFSMEFTARNLNKLAELEQELATGTNSKGSPSRLMLQSLLSSLNDPKIEYGLSNVLIMTSQTDKLRLAMMYLISQNGISEEDRQKIVNHPGLLLIDSEIQALTNLSILGVRQSISYDKSRSASENPFAHKNRSDASPRDTKFDHCRFVPAVKVVIESCIGNSLDTQLFPYITKPVVAPLRGQGSGGPPLLRNTKPSWATRRSAPKQEQSSSKEFKASGPKVIVFIVGGMTYSEMRTAYEVLTEKGREVIIGMCSTEIIAPHDFVTTLKFLHRSTAPTPRMIEQAEQQVRRQAPQTAASAASEYGKDMISNIGRRMKTGGEEGVARMREYAGMDNQRPEGGGGGRERSPLREEGRRRRSPPVNESPTRRRNPRDHPRQEEGGRGPRSGSAGSPRSRQPRDGHARSPSGQGRSPPRAADPRRMQHRDGSPRGPGAGRSSREDGRARPRADGPRSAEGGGRGPRHKLKRGQNPDRPDDLTQQMGGMRVRTDPADLNPSGGSSKGKEGKSSAKSSAKSSGKGSGKSSGRGWFGF
ncbi:MAG: hypothetical protein SGCHY_003454 [Lobulomycetales sp.]